MAIVEQWKMIGHEDDDASARSSVGHDAHVSRHGSVARHWKLKTYGRYNRKEEGEKADKDRQTDRRLVV